MGLVAPASPLLQDRSGLSFALGALSHDHCLVCGWGKEGEMAGGHLTLTSGDWGCAAFHRSH